MKIVSFLSAFMCISAASAKRTQKQATEKKRYESVVEARLLTEAVRSPKCGLSSLFHSSARPSHMSYLPHAPLSFCTAGS